MATIRTGFAVALLIVVARASLISNNDLDEKPIFDGDARAIPYVPIPPYQELYYEQTLDHFNAKTERQTYKQRYLVSDLWWDSNNPGPIFFYTGNEGNIVSFWNNTGLVFELATKFSALVVFAEHRYYGQSLPFGDAKEAFLPHHVGYLSVEQALADYAALITYLKQSWPGAGQSPVVAFGGSYGGMLSGWFRYAYPNIVDAALAASAPIPMSTGVPPSPGFWETVTNDFEGVDERCPDIVRSGFTQLLDIAAQPGGLKTLTKIFSLCHELSADKFDDMMLWLVNSFGNLAMMDYPYATDFIAPLPAWPIRLACHYMLDEMSDPLTGLARVAGLFYNGTNGTLECFDLATEFVFCGDQTGCGTGPGGWAWSYQSCVEILYFPSTNNVTDMFPPRQWTLANLTAYCEERWSVMPRPDWLPTLYGGLNYTGGTAASKIIFSNGLLDPWHGGGFLESLSEDVVAIVIADSAHHLDLRSSNPADPESVVRAREHEERLIGKWVDEAWVQRKAMPAQPHHFEPVRFK